VHAGVRDGYPLRIRYFTTADSVKTHFYSAIGYVANKSEAVASIPIPGGRSLRLVKNRGWSFDKVVD